MKAICGFGLSGSRRTNLAMDGENMHVIPLRQELPHQMALSMLVWQCNAKLSTSKADEHPIALPTRAIYPCRSEPNMSVKR